MTRIVLVGVGALGSHTALFLRNIHAQIVVCDHDRVEAKNVQAQFHPKQGVRRNKAEALSQAMQGFFGTRVEALPRKVTGDNVEALLGGAHLVIDCTDNAEARRHIQAFVKKKDIPCLHGALSADGTFARVIWTEHFTPDEEGTPGQATCEDGINLPFHAMVGAHLASTAQLALTKGIRRSWQITPTSLIRLA